MLVTVFRARLNPDAYAEYAPLATRMSELAKTMPGYIAHKVFTAEDGERVTIAEFETEEAMRNWARHPEHVAAQQQGRDKFYSEYRVQVCSVQRDSAYPRK